ncbi:MAG: hypothetical protein WC752_03540 [Patescibacteria group bacterium]|jgi:hypothetical protein
MKYAKYIITCSFLIICLPFLSKAEETNAIVSFIPQEIDDQIIYPSRFVIPEVKTFHYLSYDSVKINPAWANKGYYFEIWNDQNRPLPDYKARKLETDIIDLSRVDATQTKAIRIVIFIPDNKEALAPGDFAFSWQSGFDWRLLVFTIFTSLLIILIIIFSIYYRLKPKEILKLTKKLSFRGNIETDSKKQIILLIWIIIIFAGIYGVALGYFMGGIQILYVLIKLPLLFIGSLFISFITAYVLNLLLGGKEKATAVFINALSALAITSLILASLAPVLWFMIIIPNKHDIIVFINVLFFGIAGLIGALFFYKQSRNKNILGFLLWLFLYGLVALQLSWLLRPWVGLMENVDIAIPFLRLYDGNVFVEIFNIITRAGSGHAI